MRVLICGAGVIGASIAYFLSCREVEAIVVERTGLACAASGKAGGFLARDWCDGTPLEPLARRSFALHAQLAEQIDGDWGYRRLTTFGGFAGNRRYAHHRGNGYDIDWLWPGVRVDRRLGSPDTTAQVHPEKFTAAMMRAAQSRGAELRLGQVTGVARRSGNGRVEGVSVDGVTIKGDAVVIAMGPWSISAAAWLPLPAVFGLKGHSLVFDTDTKLSAEALFLNTGRGPEQCCPPSSSRAPTGPPMSARFPATARCRATPPRSLLTPGAIERLEAMCGDLSPALPRQKFWRDRPAAGQSLATACR